MPNIAIEDFLKQLNRLYANYFDCTTGFAYLHLLILKAQAMSGLEPLNQMDDRIVAYGNDPQLPGHISSCPTTQGEFKRRNRPDGENFIQASQNFIVTLFAHWDVEHRPKIAQSLGVKTDTLTVPVMGDVRLLRNDILHCHGILQSKNARRLEVVSTLVAKKRISFNQAGMLTLVTEIKTAMAKLPDTFSRKRLL
jgi:hypothetical protein